MEHDKQTFEIIGTVERIQVARSLRNTHVTVKCSGQFGKSHDIVFFRAVHEIDKGSHVHVKGDLSVKKLEGYKETGRDGRQYDKWITELVGREIERRAPGQATIAGTEPEGERPAVDDIPF